MAYEGDTITSANPYSSSTGQFGLPGSSGLSGGQLGGAAMLGAGALGLGAILGEGESPLPQEFTQLQQSVPGLQSQGSTLFGEGQTYANQGAQALQMAQNGVLTPQQQAQLSLYSGGLKNQTAQTFASMGRNANQDTTAISMQADNDAKVNAMAQQQIQSTIALGLGETSAGANFSGQALGYENAANQALVQAGQAQLQQDKDYSTALTGAFAAIGQIAGPALKMAMA
jgi:hypothetical protein